MTSRLRKTWPRRAELPRTCKGSSGYCSRELDALAGARAANELDGPLGDLLKRDDLGQRPVRAGEPEERLRDPLDLEAALLDERQPLVRLRARLDLAEQELDEAEHAKERVVDLVREAADELSQPGQPTGFEEGLPFRGTRARDQGQGKGSRVLRHPCSYRTEEAAPKGTIRRSAPTLDRGGELQAAASRCPLPLGFLTRRSDPVCEWNIAVSQGPLPGGG